MTEQRFRLRFPFWLNMNKPDEADLADTIAELKTQRTFAKTIRDGIRLICDLRAGRLDILFELFPWVRQEMEKRSTAAPFNSIEAQLARLEHLMTQQGDVPIERPLLPIASEAKPLIVPALSRPTFDDDDQDTIVIRKNTNTDASINLFNAMLGLQG